VIISLVGRGGAGWWHSGSSRCASKHALVPMRVLRSRDRTGSYLIMLCVGTAAWFGMFFFLTLFPPGRCGGTAR